MPRFLEVEPGKTVNLSPLVGRPEVVHVFEEADINAVNTAIAAGRPLLIRGEPGIGKSQLARAAAHELGRAFISKVIDIRVESRDLLYTFDAVRRLAVAQVEGASKNPNLANLDELKFVTPGPLWWAFHWESARIRAESTTVSFPWRPEGWTPSDGVVVLLDEIDKADASVPNGLLEALGDRRFHVVGRSEPVFVHDRAPFIVLTTNEERTLPNAFLRRCIVHEMQPNESMEDWLLRRGAAHFKDTVSEAAQVLAASLLMEDRKAIKSRGLMPPGQAEYLDLLRALAELAEGDFARQESLVKMLSAYVFRKHSKANV